MLRSGVCHTSHGMQSASLVFGAAACAAQTKPRSLRRDSAQARRRRFAAPQAVASGICLPASSAPMALDTDTVALDTDTGMLYPCGTNNGTPILSLAEPVAQLGRRPLAYRAGSAAGLLGRPGHRADGAPVSLLACGLAFWGTAPSAVDTPYRTGAKTTPAR